MQFLFLQLILYANVPLSVKTLNCILKSETKFFLLLLYSKEQS